MKTQHRSVRGKLKALGLVLSLAVTPLAAGLLTAGCAGTDYQETVGQQIDDAEISTRIRDELETDQQYKFNEVKVTTSKGHVQLGGFADSDGEKNRAEQIAQKTPGVKDVINNITVK